MRSTTFRQLFPRTATWIRNRYPAADRERGSVTTEAAVVIALLVILAVTAMSILSDKVLDKVNGISL